LKGIGRFKAAMLVILVVTLFAGLLFTITVAKPVKASPVASKWVTFIPIDDGEVEHGRPDNVIIDSKYGAFPVEYYHYWIGYNAQDGDTIAGSDQGGGWLETRVYLKYDLSGIAAATIDNAFLFCYNKYGTSNGDAPFSNTETITLDATKVDSNDWSGHTITWNNAPSMGDVIDNNFLGSGAIGWHSWDVTSWIQQQILTSHTTVSIGLKGHNETDDNLVWFYSKDAYTDQPRTYLYVQITGPAVQVAIKPTHPKYLAGYPGGTLNYTVTVANVGTVTDTYQIGKVDTAGWHLSFPTVTESLNPDQSTDVPLKVTIPSDAALGTEDTITVTATSTVNSIAKVSDNCTGLATERILPTADAYTHASRADNNYGGSLLYAGAYSFKSGPEGAERIWMKFDVSAFSPDMTVGEVYLWLYYFGGTPPGTIGHIGVYGVDSNDWGEDTITWNNSPAIGAVIDSPKELAEEGKWYYWDVTSFVQSRRAVDNIVSFCLIDIDENLSTDHSCGFAAKENTDFYMRPYLEAPGYRADVSILPKIQDNENGGMLRYTVTVTNTGGFSDSYALTVSDSASWSPGLSSTSLTNVGPDENRNVTLTVTIPSNAPVATRDTITVTATGTGVSASASCVAQAFVGFKLPPIADTFVSQGYSGTNYGDNTSMYIQSAPSSSVVRNENIYLKFDLSGIPAGETISNAEIWLWCWSAKSADIDAQCRKVTDDSWLESGLKWGTAIDLPGDLINTTALTVDVTGWYSWDVTDFVKTQYQGDSIASFCIGAAVPDANGTYIFYSKEYSDDSKRPQLRIATVPYTAPGVDVSISPTFKSGLPGSALTYTVTVTNTGNATDTYSLTKSDNAGWLPLSLSPTSLTVPANENRTATLSVTVHAPENTRDNITVIATSTENTAVKDNASCIAQAILVKIIQFEVSISPSSQDGESGGTLTYTVTLTNTGNVTDTYTLVKSNTAGWTLTLPSSVTDVAPDEDKQVTLTVGIPATAADGASTTITVTATSSENTEVENSDTCVANCVITPTGIGVQVTISGESSKFGAPGEVINFLVTVTNTGTSTDTFTLTASDTENWGPTLSIPSTTLATGASRTGIRLSVTIPSTAADGASATITVTAAGTGYENSATCTATAQAGGGISPFVYVGAVVVVVGIIAAVITVIRIKPF
jgi:uncharacterized repeat protein (TIGR01451 family)